MLVLQHEDDVPLGWLGDVLVSRGVPHDVVPLNTGEEMPEVDGRCLAVVSLGGAMSANDEDTHPYLRREKAVLRAAVERDVPVLGICLGSQLLAEALGGRVRRGPRMEAGYREVRLTQAGRGDPVLGALRNPVLSFHGDTWDLPPGAVLLAQSDNYPQAFRAGRALGLQFHAETPAADVEAWVAATGPALRESGHHPEALLEEARRREPEARAAALRLFDAWVEEALVEEDGEGGPI